MPTSGKWHNHTRSKRCPICGKSDRCKYTDDGAHRCFRVFDAPAGWKSIRTCSDGTKVYRCVDDEHASHRRRQVRRHPKSDNKVTASVAWADESARFVANLTSERLNELARILTVSCESLQALDCGWADEADLRRLGAYGKDWDNQFPAGAWSFPERSADGAIIGLSFRAPNGSKGAPAGAKRGLIIPSRYPTSDGPNLCVEGASDVAVCLTIGIRAVGRPSNLGGAEHLSELLDKENSIVVGENDDRLDEGGVARCPGREGAESVASKLAMTWGKPVRMAMPPKGSKDIRAWFVSNGVSPTDIDACRALGQQLLSKLQAGAVEFAPGPPKLVFNIEAVKNRARSTVRVLINDNLSHVDAVNLNDSNARARLAKTLARKDPRVTPEAVEQELVKRIAQREEPADPHAHRSREELLAEHDGRVTDELAAMPSGVIAEAESMLMDPKLVNAVLSDIADIGVVGEQKLALSIYLLGTSRLLEQSLAAIIQGTTSSGKSFTQKRVSELFPAEAVFGATDLSPQSLYYVPDGGLMHRFVVAGERSRNEGDEYAEAKKALREMLSGGELSKAIPVKINGRMQTVLVHQYGPIAFVESTTKTDVFDEDMNRCLALSTDESSEQTRRIMDAIAARVMRDPMDVSAIKTRHHALQRMLKRVRVVVPFADKLSKAIPADRPEGRRAITHTFCMIQSVALLYQYQRCETRPEHGSVIHATEQDYVVARNLLCGPLGRALGGALPDAVANLGRRLADRYGNGQFTTVQAAADDKIITSRSKMSEYLRSLEGGGVVELIEKGKGNKPSTWQNKAEVPEAGALWLPTLEQLQEVGPCVTV